MNESLSNSGAPSPAAWGFQVENLVCEQCDWRYLVPQGSKPPRCPHCASSRLALVEATDPAQPGIYPPELIIPFTVPSGQLNQRFQDFIGGLWLRPADLTLANLYARLHLVELPVWLVDSQVEASWQAEAGYNYQVVSHQDRYEDRRGGWSSREVTETRLRWEPRLGQLKRSYQNISAPALEEHRGLMRRLGGYKLASAQAYTPQALSGASPQLPKAICLPNRSPEDAWPDAIPSLQQAAAEECRQACAADQLREFRWSPAFQGQNWTLLLLPFLTTFYLDDNAKPQWIMVNGQNGHLSGVRRASMKRAKAAALWTGLAALLIFLLSIMISAAAVLFPPALVLGGVGLVVSLLSGVAALFPLIVVWWINRSSHEGG